MRLLHLFPYRLRLLAGVIAWCILEARWQDKGLRGIVIFLRNLISALPTLARMDLSTPRFYSVRWEDVRDVDVLRRNICKFLTAACNRAPRPYGDSRFRVAVFVGGVPLGMEPFQEFAFQDLPRLKNEILEEWFPQGLGQEWEGQDFEVVLIPVGALLHDVPLRSIPADPEGEIRVFAGPVS